MAEALLLTTAMDDDTDISRVTTTTDSNGERAAVDGRDDTDKSRLSTHDHLMSPTITDSNDGNSAAVDEHDMISAGRDENVMADSTFDAKTFPSNADATGGLSNSNGAHIDHPSKNRPRPQVTPCSLNHWPRRRILVATIGCVSSVIVCTVRVLVDNDSFAYVLHSFIVLFDMILIHIFTYTPWLSIAGETTAIIAAITYFFTHQRIFELLETTFIAVLVSIHMIQSRGEHWDREEGLEQDVIGLQLHIEQFLTNDVNGNGDIRRYSSLSIVDEDCDDKSSHAIEDARDLEIGGEANKVNFDVLSSINSTINPSMYNKEALRQQEQQRQVAAAAEIGEKSKICFQGFFEHFLDGSAGVLYTSFFGLIVDEIIQFGTDTK